MINSLGFALENYDAVGRFRQKEKEKLINAAGEYETREGKIAKFAGARELAKFLVQSEEVQESFVERMFQYLVRQPIQAYGSDCLPKLRASFVESGFNIRELAVEIVAVSALPPKRETIKLDR